MLTFKEAEVVVNRLLSDVLNEQVVNKALFKDLTEKEAAKLQRGIDKYLKKLDKLHATLVKD